MAKISRFSTGFALKLHKEHLRVITIDDTCKSHFGEESRKEIADHGRNSPFLRPASPRDAIYVHA